MTRLSLFLISTFILFPAFSQNVKAKRVADLNVIIIKNTYSEKDGGSFEETKVCEANAKIEVLNDALGEAPSTPFYKIDCPSKIGTEEVSVLVGGQINLSNKKWIHLGLWVDPDSQANQLLTYNMAFATDLSNKQASALLEPYIDMDCHPVNDDDIQCSPTVLREYFSVQAEVIDPL